MSNTFLSEFLMITNIHSILMIALLIGLFFVINKMIKKFEKTKKKVANSGFYHFIEESDLEN